MRDLRTALGVAALVAWLAGAELASRLRGRGAAVIVMPVGVMGVR